MKEWIELSTTNLEVPQSLLDETEETTALDSTDSLALLMASAGRYPLLTAAEEVALAKRVERGLPPLPSPPPPPPSAQRATRPPRSA